MTHPYLFVADLTVQAPAAVADASDLLASLAVVVALLVETAQLDDGLTRLLVRAGDATDGTRVRLTDVTLVVPLLAQRTTGLNDDVQGAWGGQHEHLAVRGVSLDVIDYKVRDSQRVQYYSAAAGTQKIRCIPAGGMTSWDRSHFDRQNL